MYRVTLLVLLVPSFAVAQPIQAQPVGGAPGVAVAPPAPAAPPPATPPPATAPPVEITPPPAESAPPPAPPSDEELMRVFYKGELGSPGATELAPVGDAFFLGVGYYNVGGILGQHYARIEPSLDLHYEVFSGKKLTLRFGAPLNVLLFDREDTSDKHGLGKFRKADYDEAGEYLKFIKSIQLGRKEERVFFNMGLLHGVTIGHGQVVRRYNANLDPDRTHVGLQLDAYNDYAGFESFISDVAMQSSVVAGLGFVKPLSLFTDNGTARSFSIGAHYATDFKAPKTMQHTVTGDYVVNDAGYPKVDDESSIGIYGFDVEFKPIRLGNAFDLKLYADYSQIADAGSGISFGTLLRSNFGTDPLLNALRVRLEGRRFDNNYIPHYFDSIYEVSRIQVLPGVPVTKLAAVTTAAASPQHTSVYAEATYALVKQFVLGAAIERITGSDGFYNLLLHVEVPAFEFLRLYASYEKLAFDDLGDSFALAKNGRSFQGNVILFSQARLMILPFLFVNGDLRQTYQFNEIKGYQPKLEFLGEVEIGWEFD